jgi:hypothetical protein
MYPKKIYCLDKIIYLLVLFFRDPNTLLLTLLFVYILPCFHPIGVSFMVMVIWYHPDVVKVPSPLVVCVFFVVVFAWCHHCC